jgi:hypothetical protein
MFFPGAYGVKALAFNTDQALNPSQILIDTGRGENWTLQQNVQIPGVGPFQWVATSNTAIVGLPIYLDIRDLANPPVLSDFVPTAAGAGPWFAAELIPQGGGSLAPFWAVSTPEPPSLALACLALPALLLAHRRWNMARVTSRRRQSM